MIRFGLSVPPAGEVDAAQTGDESPRSVQLMATYGPDGEAAQSPADEGHRSILRRPTARGAVTPAAPPSRSTPSHSHASASTPWDGKHRGAQRKQSDQKVFPILRAGNRRRAPAREPRHPIQPHPKTPPSYGRAARIFSSAAFRTREW